MDSWLTGRAGGSGTAVGVAGLAGALASAGHEIREIRPDRPSASLRRRLLFNLALPFRLDPGPLDVLVTVDLDGCFLPDGGLPRVACVKGVAADELRFESGPPRWRLAVQARLERRAVRRADRVVVPSRYSREAVRSEYGVAEACLRVVPEGIHVASWRSAAEAPRERRRPTVLSVARQYPRKNTETLLRAAARLRGRVEGLEVRVVGGGPRLPALRRQATRSGLDATVTFLGELEDEEAVRAEYAAADLFCLPSRQEGFGIVFLEAMASGLPVVAGDAAAAPEVVPDGEAGLLVPPADDEALARAVERLLRDRGLRARMGARGRERAERYDWPRVAERFLSVVDEVRPRG